MAIFTYTAKYVIVNSATCASKGHHLISSKNECEKAARDLGLSDTSAFEMESSLFSTGCVFDRNIDDNDHLGFNTDDNYVACGTKVGGIAVDCICTIGKFNHFYA